MITNIFWTVVALDAIAAVVLWKLFERGTHGLLVAVFIAVLVACVIPAIAFPLLRSEGFRIAALVALLLPSLPLVFYSAVSAFNAFQDQTQSSGSAFFDGKALQLAQAITQRDFELAKQLIPAAGDLNQPHGHGMTLWQFAVLRADNTDGSLDLLRALIAAGADPKRDTSPDTLESGLARGAPLTQLLLESGVNPNLLDRDKTPVWWRTFSQGEDDESTQLLRLMLDHGVDFTLRDREGRGPVAKAIAARYWYDACLLIERGADWKQDQPRGWPIPQLLEWEIIRREEWPLPIPQTLRTVLATMKGEPPPSKPLARVRQDGERSIPEILRETSYDNLDQTRAAVTRLAHDRPDWVRRVVAFFEEGDSLEQNHVALLLSLKPEALPEDVQERCWLILRDQIAWYDRSTASYPNERKGWLLKETGVIATGLASINGPARDHHRADFIALRDRIEACRKANDPDAAKLADLRKADWIPAGQ